MAPPALATRLFLPVPQDVHCDCNAAHDFMVKALAATEGGDGALWAPHPEPTLQHLVDSTTAGFQAALLAVQDSFAQAITGRRLGTLAKSLEGRLPAHFELEDWLHLCDTIIARYMPATAINGEAEAMVLRADLLGRVKAILPIHQPLHLDDLAHITELLPTEFAKVPLRVLNPVELSTLRYAKASAALHITDLVDSTRAAIKRMVIEHSQGMILGQREGTARALEQRLSDTFGDLNRDWRRLAISEIGECANQGHVAAETVGTKLKRVEAYTGACQFCRSIDQRVMEVVSPDHPDKDGWLHIWPGKTNVGRAAAKRKIDEGHLVDRTHDELWWPASGIQHPNCRGRWVRVDAGSPPAVSPEFKSYLNSLIRRATTRARNAA